MATVTSWLLNRPQQILFTLWTHFLRWPIKHTEIVAEEMSRIEPVESNNGLQNFKDADADADADETLSFCNLPLSNSSSSSASDWEDFDSSKEEEEQRTSFEDDFFEFFREDFTASAHSMDKDKDNIIFCGKLIPLSKQPKVADKARNLNDVTIKPKETKDSGISPWKLDRSRTTTSAKTRLAATPVKLRWYVLSFGSGRLPGKMELSDMRTRLMSKKSLQAAAKMFQSHNGKEVKNNIAAGTGRKEKGFWSLFRDFGCKSCDANAVVW